MTNRKLGKVVNLRKIIPSFQFCPTAKIENSDLKFSEKILRDFRDFRGLRVFDLARKNRPYQEAIMKILYNKTVK